MPTEHKTLTCGNPQCRDGFMAELVIERIPAGRGSTSTLFPITMVAQPARGAANIPEHRERGHASAATSSAARPERHAKASRRLALDLRRR
jgi:hypothetical protein